MYFWPYVRWYIPSDRCWRVLEWGCEALGSELPEVFHGLKRQLLYEYDCMQAEYAQQGPRPARHEHQRIRCWALQRFCQNAGEEVSWWITCLKSHAASRLKHIGLRWEKSRLLGEHRAMRAKFNTGSTKHYPKLDGLAPRAAEPYHETGSP